MQIPLNILHNYIGAPILGALAIEIYRRNRKNPNPTLRHLFWAFVFYTICLTSLAVPIFFTHDTYIISLGSAIGDSAQAIGTYFLWSLFIITYLSAKPQLKRTAYILVGLLTLGIVFEAYFRNLVTPYGAHVIASGSGIAVIYRETLFYKIANGLDSLGLLVIGVVFWRQSIQAPGNTQKWRIRSLAAAALCGVGAFTIGPFFPINEQLWATMILMTAGFSFIGLGAIAGLLARKNS